MGNLTYGILKQNLVGITCAAGQVTLLSNAYQTSPDDTYKISRVLLTAPIHNLTTDLFVAVVGLGSTAVPDATAMQIIGHKYTADDKELSLRIDGNNRVYVYVGALTTLRVTEWHGARNG